MSIIDGKELTQQPATSSCRVLIWPDGTWCWQQDLPAHTDKSDDYTSIDVPEWGDELDIEAIATVIQRDGMIEPEHLAHIWGI